METLPRQASDLFAVFVVVLIGTPSQRRCGRFPGRRNREARTAPFFGAADLGVGDFNRASEG
jgi:hypothetical protein